MLKATFVALGTGTSQIVVITQLKIPGSPLDLVESRSGDGDWLIQTPRTWIPGDLWASGRRPVFDWR